MNTMSKTILHGRKFLALVKEGRWEYVDRIGTTGAVIIVAVTDERKLLLVEQYRIPVHASSCLLGSLEMNPVTQAKPWLMPQNGNFSKKRAMPQKVSKRSRPARPQAA